MNFNLFFLTLFALIAAFAVSVEANGASCQLYGHSCLGGHGKRSDSSADTSADGVNSFQNRALTGPRINVLMQRLLARRFSPDMLAAYMAGAAASSSEVADMDKRSADYMS